MQHIQPVLALNPLTPNFVNTSLLEFLNSISNTTGTSVAGRNSFIKSAMIKPGGFNATVVNIVMKYINNRITNDSVILWSHFGGKISEVAPNATAFYRRNYQYVFEAKAVWTDPADEERSLNWVKDFFVELAPYVEGAYLNYIDTSLENWQEAYYGTNYERLKKIKKKVDPTNFFKFPLSIGGDE